MGRHSAPDDDSGQEPRVVAVLDVATLLGRHAPARPGPKPRPARPTEEPKDDDALAPELAGDQVGLELIEDALAAVPVEEAETPEVVTPDSHTAQIAPVVEPEPSVPEAPTAQIPLVEDLPAEAKPAPDAVPADAVPADAVPVAKEARAASSDLALIRAYGDVRARCLAGVLVPFVLYVVALVLISSFTLTTFLLWIWIPLISAGILVGMFLDSAHKRYHPPTGEAVSGSADRP